MCIQKEIQKEWSKIKQRIAEFIINERETRQWCNTYDRSTMWNVSHACEECRSRESIDNENEEMVNGVKGVSGENWVNEEIITRKKRCEQIEVKGRVTKTKDKGRTRLFFSKL